MDTSSLRKIFGIILVVGILSLSAYLLFPSLFKIFDYSAKSTSESNTESIIKFTRDMYATLNMNEGVVLPFKLEFDGKGYKIYSGGVEYTPTSSSMVDASRELPKSGYIEIREDGSIDAQNLRYALGGYVCSQTSESRPVCIK